MAKQHQQREWIVVHATHHICGIRVINGKRYGVKEVAVSVHASYLEAVKRMAVEAMQDRELVYGVVEL